MSTTTIQPIDASTEAGVPPPRPQSPTSKQAESPFGRHKAKANRSTSPWG